MTASSGPTWADLYRLRTACARARREVAAARTAFHVARRAAFRRGLASTVRFASPFLVGLLANEGLELDDVLRRIEPLESWPKRPRLSSSTGRRMDAGHAPSHVAHGPGTYSSPGWDHDAHSIVLPLDDGGSADVRIVAHSVEVRARIGGLFFETRFGELRITMSGAVPDAVAAESVGRLIDVVVGHPATDGRGWRVASVENVISGTFLAIPTGCVPWSVGR